MDKEMIALRRIAQAVRMYREMALERPEGDRTADDAPQESRPVVDVLAAESAFSDALNAWFRTQVGRGEALATRVTDYRNAFPLTMLPVSLS